MQALQFLDCQLRWPDGTLLFDALSLTIPSGTVGLVGANGTGKSTLLRILAGDLAPTRGTVRTPERVGYLPQDLSLQVGQRVDDHLGIARARRAIAAISAGDTDPRHFDTVGDGWDVEERAIALLARLRLPAGVLDRRLGELSGGEVARLAVARLLLARPQALLLDEPTNNLDRDGREALRLALDDWQGTAVIVSHDRELLGRVDHIGELRAGPGGVSVTWYSGGLAEFQDAVAAAQHAAQRSVRAAEGELRRQRADLVQAQVTLARRQRFGRKKSATLREPKIVMNARQREAQVSAAKYRGLHQDRVARARERLSDAESQLRDDTAIRIDLPGTEVPGGRRIVVTRDLVLANGPAIDVHVSGPERVAVTGPNGSGKTTALRTLLGLVPPRSGEADVLVPARMLPQRIDILDGRATVVDNVRRHAPEADPHAIRARLARFGFRGTAADLPVTALSGGQRFRAALAALLLAQPSPQLLMLDEPTNNLDFDSVSALVSALEAYRGALLVVSHDEAFLREIGVQRRIAL